MALLALATGALLAPYLLSSATAEADTTLSIEGGTSLILGNEYTINAAGLPGLATVVFRIDERNYGWLPAGRTTADGTFSGSFTLRHLDDGSHELTVHERSPDTAEKGPALAQLALTVSGDDSDPASGAPLATSTPAAIADPTPTGQPEATPAATPAPATPPAAPATPAATVPQPTQTGSVSAPLGSAIVGYGRDTIGGNGGRTVAVTTLADSGPGSLRDALSASGPRVITFGVAGVIDLKTPIRVTEPFVTIAGESAPAPGVQIRGETLSIGTHDVIVQYMRFRPGDATADSPGEADGLTINGGSGGDAYNIVIDHVEAIWGPDIGGLAILNNVRDVTVQHSILGEGLFRSRHPEAHEDADGHGLATNITGLSGDSFPSRVTYYRNLITTSQGRNPRVQGAYAVDLVNNVIYNFDQSPQGNPQALNMVNNVLRSGPAPAAAGLSQETAVWRAVGSSDFSSLFSGSVYLAGNVADGFTLGALDGPASVLAGSPKEPLSVTAEPTAGLVERVLAEVGPRQPTVDAVTARLLDNVRNRTGTYVNGDGEKALNPYWP